MMNNQLITPGDVEALAVSHRREAALIRWHDTGEIDLVSRQNFNDVSYEHRKRAYQLIVTQMDLELLAGGEAEMENLSDFQLVELARGLNENREPED